MGGSRLVIVIYHIGSHFIELKSGNDKVKLCIKRGAAALRPNVREATSTP